MVSSNLRSHLVVAAALIALAASPALAQSRPGPAASTPSAPRASGDGGRIILYGTPDNCPPTMVCGPQQRRPPVVLPRRTHCDRWEWVRTRNGRRIRRCTDR